jgi:hypothetical protein
MTTQHTPGPWRVQNKPGKGYGKEFVVYTPVGRAFEGDQLKPDGVSIGAAQANARLAAAAPDLLDALRGLIRDIGVSAVYQDHPAYNAARAAIAKATKGE